MSLRLMVKFLDNVFFVLGKGLWRPSSPSRSPSFASCRATSRAVGHTLRARRRRRRSAPPPPPPNPPIAFSRHPTTTREAPRQAPRLALVAPRARRGRHLHHPETRLRVRQVLLPHGVPASGPRKVRRSTRDARPVPASPRRTPPPRPTTTAPSSSTSPSSCVTRSIARRARVPEGRAPIVDMSAGLGHILRGIRSSRPWRASAAPRFRSACKVVIVNRAVFGILWSVFSPWFPRGRPRGCASAAASTARASSRGPRPNDIPASTAASVAPVRARARAGEGEVGNGRRTHAVRAALGCWKPRSGRRRCEGSRKLIGRPRRAGTAEKRGQGERRRRGRRRARGERGIRGARSADGGAEARVDDAGDAGRERRTRRRVGRVGRGGPRRAGGGGGGGPPPRESSDPSERGTDVASEGSWSFW